MINNVESIVLIYVFVILLAVIFKPVKSAFNLDTFPSCLLSVCVSALCIIGMRHFLKGSIEVILLPYAIMAMLILAVLILSFIGQHSKGKRKRLSDHTTCKDELRKTNNKQLRR